MATLETPTIDTEDQTQIVLLVVFSVLAVVLETASFTSIVGTIDVQ